MSCTVKGQLNRPKNGDGGEMRILQPGTFSIRELITFARQQGFDSFPDPSDPRNFPYWQTYCTSGACPRVLVSCTGMVAAKFGEADIYQILQQQWSYQGQESWSQKYLNVWLATNPAYPTDSSAHGLHRLVGSLHSNITTDLVYTDVYGRNVLRPRLQVDHLDKDKSNNSVFNLFLVTAEQNQRMRSFSVDEKRAYYASRVGVDKAYLDSSQIH
ncbi:MAG: HNH endonuclease [Azonexaceae bacterium]|nr:HNH endonuclease [Azonexaceae bacterium]